MNYSSLIRNMGEGRERGSAMRTGELISALFQSVEVCIKKSVSGGLIAISEKAKIKVLFLNWRHCTRARGRELVAVWTHPRSKTKQQRRAASHGQDRSSRGS